MIRTRVGYAGGTTENPTYHNLGDHSETLQIEYDPAVISYAELLEVFWNGHSPGRRSFSRQYRSAIYVHNEYQEQLARESKERRQSGGILLSTEIEPYQGFTRAEGYHQKYMLQRFDGIAREFRSIYPHEREFTDSTAAARVNGYLGGFGTRDDLIQDVNSLGLSPRAQQQLLELVSNRKQRI